MLMIKEDLLHELYKKYFEKYENLNNVDFNDFEKDAKSAHYEILDTLDSRAKRKEITKIHEFLMQIENIYPNLMTKLEMTCQEFSKKSKHKHNHHPRAGGILVDPTYTKILLVEDSFSGKYNIPKGKVYAGEGTFVAAKRQIIENTGYDPEDNIERENPVEIHSHGTDLHTLYFVNNVPSDDMNLFKYSRDKEIADIEFLEIDRIKSNGYYGNTRKKVTVTVTKCLSQIKEFCILKRMEKINI